ncbi:hypothetical protein [Vibrio gallaecicus]|nr:hypothetical protein [Vibrio gallaecicus]MDN3617286.1 hypothetical protein [Vibrio gallaecicus]
MQLTKRLRVIPNACRFRFAHHYGTRLSHLNVALCARRQYD